MNDSSRLTGLVAKPKPSSARVIRDVDEMAEGRGFVDRSPRKKPGRKPSPRTYQIHPKLLPDIGEAIAEEAGERGITQGHLIEMMWKCWQKRQRDG